MKSADLILYRWGNLGVLAGIILACLWVAAGFDLLPSGSLYTSAFGAIGPTTGLTRAMRLLLQGHPSAAEAMHPAAPWLLTWCAAQVIWRAQRARATAIPAWWPWDVAVSLITYITAIYLPLFVR